MVNGQPMLKHPKIAAEYAETLAKWVQKVEAGEKSRAARQNLRGAARPDAAPAPLL